VESTGHGEELPQGFVPAGIIEEWMALDLLAAVNLHARPEVVSVLVLCDAMECSQETAYQEADFFIAAMTTRYVCGHACCGILAKGLSESGALLSRELPIEIPVEVDIEHGITVGRAYPRRPRLNWIGAPQVLCDF
jgi:hypothetical protein